MASVFSPKYEVTVKLIAATPALRKKTNSVRGTAGVRRKRVMMEIRQQKSKSTSKLTVLTYMDRQEPRRPMEPAEKPSTAEPAEPSSAEKFVHPDPTLPTSSDEEVLVALFLHWPILTIACVRLLLLRLLLRLFLRPQSGAGQNARPCR